MSDTDLRSPLADGQRRALALISATRPDQLGDPTPCTDYSVRVLIRHLIGGTRRVAAMGAGRSALEVNAHPDNIADADLAEAFADAMGQAQLAWRDDAGLTREVRVPWGTVTGAQALGGYLTEVLAHGWDLAVATGQQAEIDPSLAALALALGMAKVPPGERVDVPFGPAVEPAPEAGPTERFVNWMGRRSRPYWVR
jgi:uncharacterized protein (TIGR03086 family)